MNKQLNNITNRNSDQRVVITGMGAITPVGNTVAEMWEAFKNGRSGLTRITMLDATSWPCQVAGELKDFYPNKFISRKKIRYMSQTSQLAVIAAGQALEDSGLVLVQEDQDRIGVFIGTAAGSCVEETEQAILRLREKKRPSPFKAVEVWPNLPAYHIAEIYQVRGYNGTICTACAASTQAIGEAAEIIRRGEAQVMITGGAESMVSETVLAGFCAIKALATSYNDKPERAMRPFDADREGFVSAQGGAMLILESLSHAQERGAPIYAEVLGCGNSTDAYHMITPDPKGEGQALAMLRALKSASVGIEAVDYINSHSTSTPLGDVAETKAIKSVFGERAYNIPISSTKSMIGHMMGAAGAVEAVACVMSIKEGVIHPTINYETPDPECDLDYVPNEARRTGVKIAMSNSFGLGGQNSVLVLGSI
jgi:3-oxoacyl-[acyl-carrier-protein] synthase II